MLNNPYVLNETVLDLDRVEVIEQVPYTPAKATRRQKRKGIEPEPNVPYLNFYMMSGKKLCVEYASEDHRFREWNKLCGLVPEGITIGL